jgi:inosine-uridine nucleoside N-ribohydrolase
MATRNGRKRLESIDRQFSYCDEVCVGIVIDPKIIVTEKLIRGTVELHGTFTRGQIALAWVESLNKNDQDTSMSELKFVMDYNVQALDKLMHETIHRCPNIAK